MKNGKRIVAAVLCVCVILSMCGCGSRSDTAKIQKTLDNYIAAYQEMDFDGMMDCMDPNMVKVFNATTGWMENLTGADYDALIDMTFSSLGDFIGTDFLDSIEVEVTDVDFSKDHSSATVTCTLGYELNGEKLSSPFGTYMVERDGDWYIAGQR